MKADRIVVGRFHRPCHASGKRGAAVIAEWWEGTAEDRDEYIAENISWVPPEARWAHLKRHARRSTVGLTVDQAMGFGGDE